MASNDYSLIIASEFSETPGPRFEIEGEFSGELFREKLLRPRFEAAVRDRVLLYVDLDGVEGYATSFLEEAFGGLAREFSETLVEATLRFKSDEVQSYVAEIVNYIRDARR